MTAKPHPRRGYVMADTLIAVALLGAAALTMATAKTAVGKLDARLADRRAAVRAAEAYLNAPTAVPAGWTVQRLPTPAPPGRQWVRVTAVVHGTRGELSGLVRSEP